jgi:hypothetical protein
MYTDVERVLPKAIRRCQRRCVVSRQTDEKTDGGLSNGAQRKGIDSTRLQRGARDREPAESEEAAGARDSGARPRVDGGLSAIVALTKSRELKRVRSARRSPGVRHRE